jgi:hypothetical protein
VTTSRKLRNWCSNAGPEGCLLGCHREGCSWGAGRDLKSAIDREASGLAGRGEVQRSLPKACNVNGKSCNDCRCGRLCRCT